MTALEMIMPIHLRHLQIQVLAVVVIPAIILITIQPQIIMPELIRTEIKPIHRKDCLYAKVLFALALFLSKCMRISSEKGQPFQENRNGCPFHQIPGSNCKMSQF